MVQVSFTGSGIMTIFVYIGLTRNLISEIPPSEICLISGDWDDLGIPNFAQMSLMKSTEYCKMPGLKLLPFLSHYGKTNKR